MEHLKIDEKVLDQLRPLPSPQLIGVSGVGGAGKSSWANLLGNTLSIPVIGVDSFQKSGAFDLDYSVWEIMDFSRLEKEVLQPFTEKQTVRYGHYNVPSNSISKIVEIPYTGKLIVEGVGLFRPELIKYFTFKIWIDCPVEVAIARGKKRDREEYNNPTDTYWDGVWKKNDTQYIQQFDPKSKADLIINN
ncbi:MAG: hypothetical protein V4481_03565 [Patescibacteria group bacterium]